MAVDSSRLQIGFPARTQGNTHVAGENTWHAIHTLMDRVYLLVCLLAG
ncbi:hypothetical protein [uncultured Methanospirillum sp.]|nr:hypothetical protein [uncultured Methanospirillum sp.]